MRSENSDNPRSDESPSGEPQSNEPDGPDSSGDATLDERYFAFVEEVNRRRANEETISVDALAAALSIDLDLAEQWLRQLHETEEAMPAGPYSVAERLAKLDLPEDYELIGELGRGGMGIVYRVTQRSLDRTLALKVLRPGDLTYGDRLERFQREARSLARLKHPHIVPVYEVGETGDHLYFTMDYIEGESLAKRLSREALTPTLARKVASQVASAIAHAHERGLVHRDLKPANILLDAEQNAHVVDFGLAIDTGMTDSRTMTGRLLGTPAYMSPEQARGDRTQIGERSDVYSLGAVLYQCLAGRAPFPQKNFGDLIEAVLFRNPPRLRTLMPNVPRDLERIVMKAMAKEPEDRYSTMEAFRRDLELFGQGKPIEARAPKLSDRAVRWVGRNRAAVAVGTIGTAGLVAALILSFAFLSRLAPQRLLDEAKVLREEGQVDAAQRLESLADQLTVVPPPGPTAAQQTAFFEDFARRLRRGVLAVAAESPGADEAIQALQRELEARKAEAFPDVGRQEWRWFELRIEGALSRWKDRPIPLVYLPSVDFLTRWRAWAREVAADQKDPEWPVLLGYINDGRESAVITVAEDPELYRRIILDHVLHGPREHRSWLPDIPMIRHEFPRHDVSELVDSLVEIVGDSQRVVAQRDRAADVVSRLLNLPMVHRAEGEPINRARLILQYQELRGLDWKAAWEKRVEIAQRSDPLTAAVWGRAHGVGGFDQSPAMLWEWLAKSAANLDLTADLAQFLAAYRDRGSKELQFLATERAISLGRAAAPRNGCWLESAEFPWEVLREAEPTRMRAACFLASEGGDLPTWVASDQKARSSSEADRLDLSFKLPGEVVGTFQAPGFDRLLRPPFDRAPLVLVSEKHKRGRVGLQLTGAAFSLNALGESLEEHREVLTRSTQQVIDATPQRVGCAFYSAESEDLSGEPQYVLLYAEEPTVRAGEDTSAEPWSISEWQSQISARLRRFADLVRPEHSLSAEELVSLRVTLSAAIFFPVPDAIEAMRKIREFGLMPEAEGDSDALLGDRSRVPRSRMRQVVRERVAQGLKIREGNRRIREVFDLLVLARLLAGDSQALAEFPWRANDSQQRFGPQLKLGSGYLSRLLVNTSDLQIREFALEALKDREISASSGERLKRFRSANRDADLQARLDPLIERAKVRDREISPWLGLWLALWIGVVVGLIPRFRNSFVGSWGIYLAGVSLCSLTLFYGSTALSNAYLALGVILFGHLRISKLAREEERSPWLTRLSFFAIVLAIAATVVLAFEPIWSVDHAMRIFRATCVAVSLVLLSVLRWKRPWHRAPVKVLGTFAYGGLVGFAFANWLWARAAWGDAAPSLLLYRELAPAALIVAGCFLLTIFRNARSLPPSEEAERPLLLRWITG